MKPSFNAAADFGLGKTAITVAASACVMDSTLNLECYYIHS